jgi:hypothetical protein
MSINSGDNNLIYSGIAIGCRDEMLSLTDMWRAAGSDPARQPAEWQRSADALRFVEFLTETFNLGNSQIELFKAQRGGHKPGTYAHWQIGLAYAKYLSPEFHMWCNTVVRERMEQRAPLVPVIFNEDSRRAVGGIVRSVLGKTLDERLSPLEATLENAVALVRGLIIERDPRVGALEYRPMLEVLLENKVEPKRRRQLSQRCSTRCRRWLLRQNRGEAIRLSAETGRHLFQVDALREWMDVEGRVLIGAHKDAVAGQAVMRFLPKSVAS